jgi:hypothetical protein
MTDVTDDFEQVPADPVARWVAGKLGQHLLVDLAGGRRLSGRLDDYDKETVWLTVQDSPAGPAHITVIRAAAIEALSWPAPGG